MKIDSEKLVMEVDMNAKDVVLLCVSLLFLSACGREFSTKPQASQMVPLISQTEAIDTLSQMPLTSEESSEETLPSLEEFQSLIEELVKTGDIEISGSNKMAFSDIFKSNTLKDIINLIQSGQAKDYISLALGLLNIDSNVLSKTVARVQFLEKIVNLAAPIIQLFFPKYATIVTSVLNVIHGVIGALSGM